MKTTSILSYSVFIALIGLAFVWNGAEATTETTSLDCTRVINLYKQATAPDWNPFNIDFDWRIIANGGDNRNENFVMGNGCIYMTDFSSNFFVNTSCSNYPECTSVGVEWIKVDGVTNPTLFVQAQSGSHVRHLQDHYNTGFVFEPEDVLRAQGSASSAAGSMTPVIYYLNANGFQEPSGL